MIKYVRRTNIIFNKMYRKAKKKLKWGKTIATAGIERAVNM